MSDPAQQDSADPAAHPDPDVAVALGLGWDMATLDHSALPRASQEHPHRVDLSTLSDLNGWEWTDIRLGSVGVALVSLSPALGAGGLAPPSLDALTAAFAGQHKDVLVEVIATLHSELVSALYARSPRLGKAYTLGRSLAYTSLKPTDTGSLEEQLRAGRLTVLQAWLADLATALPAHSARAVAVSLEMWRQAVPVPPPESDPDPAGAADRPGAMHPGAPGNPDVQGTLGAVRRQGALWRDLLSGEKDGRDMLSPSDYLDAGSRMMRRTSRLAVSFAGQHWGALVTGVLVTAAIIAALLLSSGGSASKVAGSIATVAAALGVSWSAIRASLGKTLAKLEQPLWQAELDTAIAEAITVIPPNARGTRAAAGVAAELHPRGPSQAAS